MSEWSNVPAWKASIAKAIGGSNPLLSANETKADSQRLSAFILATKSGKGLLGAIILITGSLTQPWTAIPSQTPFAFPLLRGRKPLLSAT